MSGYVSPKGLNEEWNDYVNRVVFRKNKNDVIDCNKAAIIGYFRNGMSREEVAGIAGISPEDAESVFIKHIEK